MKQTLSVPAKKIRRDFISYLASNYAIDESGNFPRAIKASGRSSNLSSLTYEFAPWAKGVPSRRVPEHEFGSFMTGFEIAIRGGLARVCGISFKPVSERSFVDSKGDTLLNTYLHCAPERPANYSAVKEVLDDYANRLFHQGADDKKHVLQLCADIVANPARRPQWGVIMRGTSGTGKSSLIGLLKVATGGRYVWSENDYAPAFSQFSEVLPNNLVVCFDDATATKHTYEDLKLAVTRDTANVQIKGVQSILEREVFSRVFVLSNSHRPFVMPADSSSNQACGVPPTTPTPPARILFGQRLRLAREALSLSQEGLAERADIHRTYVSQVESGRRNIAIDNMERLAKAVEMELWQMLRP
jgi:DNA-binding XRE family transcriptional regulator